MPLIVSVSGVRGIVGSELTAEIATRYAAALGTVLGGGPIALARDSRPSGMMLRHAAIAGLTGVGCSVRDFGIVPTPTCGFLVRESGCRGGLMITASHNPAPYNGLKLFGPDGAVLSAAAGAEVQRVFVSNAVHNASWDQCGTLEGVPGFDLHLQRVLNLVEVDAIRSHHFHVALDGNGGAGGPPGIALLDSLGCRVVAINCVADGVFRHEPEPTPAHLQQVAQLVKMCAGAFGLVLDPDSDRLALIDESGECLSEELTLALAVQARLTQDHGPVVINLSTSRATADIAAAAGVPCHRAAVGEANVVAKMREVNAMIGGEGNGGVIDPRVGWVRDPFIGIGLILGQMARTGKSLKELASALPKYFIEKSKCTVDRTRLALLLDSLPKQWPDAKVDRTDGVRLDWDDHWVHLRASNTEPIVRVIAEAGTEKQAKGICQQISDLLESG